MKAYTLTPADIARIFNKSPRWVAKEILSGRLVGIKVGRTFRVAQEDFEEYVDRLLGMTPQQEWSEEFQSAIDQHQLEADNRYCEDHGT